MDARAGPREPVTIGAVRTDAGAPGASPTALLIGDRLREAAELLEQQGANPFRVRAYREAAQVVAQCREDLRAIYERRGVEGLDALPGIGPRIAAAVAEMLHTGRWSQLERLRGTLDPESYSAPSPGWARLWRAAFTTPSTSTRSKPWRWRRMMAGWRRCLGSARAAPPRCEPRWRAWSGVSGCGSVTSRGPSLRSSCCSTSTAPTGRPRWPIASLGSPPGASIPPARRGCRSSTSSGDPGR